MENETTIAAEVYEDNAGGLTLYAYDWGEPIWSASYRADEDGLTMLAQDFCALASAIDPRAAGWDGDEGLDPDAETGTLIASTDWYDGSDDSLFARDPARYGNAGRAFAVEYLDRLPAGLC